MRGILFASFSLLAALSLAPGAGALLLPGSVNVTDFAFVDGTTGTDLTLASGSVTWVTTQGFHTVTADDGSFDSGLLVAGQAFTANVAGPAVISYSCTLHAGMVGTLVVG